MSRVYPDNDSDSDTLEHLLGVVVENREQRCREVREDTHRQAAAIIEQAHARSRARLHRHVEALRDKYRQRVASATARNQTLLRQQHQRENRAILDVAWPGLRASMLALWREPATRREWMDAAMATAANSLRESAWHIEHPAELDDEDVKWLKHRLAAHTGKGHKLVVSKHVEAGIRIIARSTVVDAGVDGLLRHRDRIEAGLIARIQQSVDDHE